MVVPAGKKSKVFFRTKFLVYPRFQLMLIAINSFLTVCTFGITISVSSRAFSRFAEMGHSIKLSPDHPYFKLIEFQANSLYSSLIISFLIAIVTATVTTLVLSHRLAGPIVRLRNYFREIAGAKTVTTKLKFRNGDFFEDLPSAVNDALDAISKPDPAQNSK